MVRTDKGRQDSSSKVVKPFATGCMAMFALVALQPNSLAAQVHETYWDIEASQFLHAFPF